MEKVFAKYIRDNGFDTLVTNQYLNKGVFDTFSNIISLSNSRSCISASIGCDIFKVNTVSYITNFFEFLYIYDDCYKDIPLNLLVVIDEINLPEHFSIDILNNYNVKYCKLKSLKKIGVVDEILKHASKNKGSGLIVLGEGYHD